MRPRAEREAVLERQRAMLSRGDLTPEERVEFDCSRAWEMRQAELRRHPQPQLDLPEPH